MKLRKRLEEKQINPLVYFMMLYENESKRDKELELDNIENDKHNKKKNIKTFCHKQDKSTKFKVYENNGKVSSYILEDWDEQEEQQLDS